MTTDDQAMQQYLEREHRVPRERAALQVGGGSEFGVDGFHFDPERRNLYLFQFRNSASYQAAIANVESSATAVLMRRRAAVTSPR